MGGEISPRSRSAGKLPRGEINRNSFLSYEAAWLDLDFFHSLTPFNWESLLVGKRLNGMFCKWHLYKNR